MAFNDVDYCLKLREKGLLVVYTPEVELYHYESVSRGAEDSPEKIARFHSEIAYMNWRWSSIYINGDPYMSVNTQRVEPRKRVLPPVGEGRRRGVLVAGRRPSRFPGVPALR